MKNKGNNSLQGKKLHKIDDGSLTNFEVRLFDGLRATQRLWLWLEGLITPFIIKIFAARGIDFELVRRFDTKTADQEKLILKLVDTFRNASEIYMALGEMGHGLMERADVLEAFAYAKRDNNATIQIVHGPRVDPKTKAIFDLASNKIVELYRSPQYFRRHFSYVRDKSGKVTIFDEGVHDETIWVLDENKEPIPLFTSLGRHQYLMPDSNRLKDYLKDEFEYRKMGAEQVDTPPKRFIPSDYSAFRIFWTSTFENLPRRHFIQPLENYFDMPLGIRRQDTRKSKGVVMNEKMKWTKTISARHYAWFLLFLFAWIFGLADILRYVFAGLSFLHWFNDILLMFGSISLAITVVMVLMEETK